MKVNASIKKFLVQFSTCLFLTNCFAETNSVIGVSSWSEPVESLRARLHILEGFSTGYMGQVPETLVYLELENVGLRPLHVYFDPRKGLHFDLRDTRNQPPPPVGTGGSGGFPGACWVRMPRDSRVRLRASWYGYGMRASEGLKIPVNEPIIIKADNTNEYFLSVTVSATPPTNYIAAREERIWEGKLDIPKIKISSRRR